MAGVSAQGATFTFNGIAATITGMSVETPTAEVADMTGINDAVGATVLVPTGAASPGRIQVDYIHAAGGIDPQAVLGVRGTLYFGSPGYSVSRNAILESASTEVRTGDVVRGSIRFVMTDYYGS
jgi:hypothetical protein